MTPDERAKKTASTISGYPNPGVVQCWADAIRAAETDALERAAGVCAQAAIRLISNGRARVNQVDRHTSEVLRTMEERILALKPVNAAGTPGPIGPRNGPQQNGPSGGAAAFSEGK